MENEITNTPMEMDTNLSITTDGKGYLSSTSKWATFLSIIGFVGAGIITLVALFLLIISPFMGASSRFGSTHGFPTVVLGVVYLLLGILYFFPAYYLYRFADKLKSALNTNNQDTLDESLKNLKKTFKFIGIMTIVIISAYLITIPVLIFLSLSKSMAF